MVTDIKLPLGSRCIKYMMFIFNLLFVITGIILLSIGAVIKSIYTDYEHFLDDRFFSLPNLLIALGIIIFLIAFFGCYGAIRENYCMILTFVGLMVLIFILEFSAGIAGYVLRNKAGDIIETKMNESMLYAYNISHETDHNNTNMWYTMQKNFECCGTKGPEDWAALLDNNLPTICCKPLASSTGVSECIYNKNHTDAYWDGCYGKVTGLITSHAVEIGGAGLGIAFVQAIGIWFAMYLARAIKASYEVV